MNLVNKVNLMKAGLGAFYTIWLQTERAYSSGARTERNIGLL